MASAAQVSVALGFTPLDSASGAITNSLQNGGNSGPVTAGTNDAQSVQLETNNLPRMTITSTGNVGIGTTSPGASLQINATEASVFIPL